MLGIEHAVFCLTIVMQMLGIASVACARLSERSSLRVFFQRTCYFFFVAIGVATMLAVTSDSTSWFTFAATLGAMSVGATVDFSPRRRITAAR